MSSAAELVARQATPSTFCREEIMAARSTRQHPASQPVSRSTYVNHGCRCNGCKDANAAYGARRAGREPRPRQHRALIKARNAERRRRENLAITRAHAALVILHNEQYKLLLRAHRAQIDSECGPLPGDPS